MQGVATSLGCESVKERALIVGGTGPTGPLVVEGLARRGYGITILHTGQHEVEFGVRGVEHIHADPHFEDTFRVGLGKQTFDIVIVQYGRLSIISDVMRGRTPRVVAIGAASGIYAVESDPRWGALGRPAVFPDTTNLFVARESDDKLRYRMVQALERLFEYHAEGSYAATYLGYPVNYGPNQPGPQDWSIIRRVLDGRRHMIIADAGLKLESRIFVENAASAVLAIVDNPGVAAGKRYTVADARAYTIRQRIEFVARYLDKAVELVDMPYEVAWPCYPLWRHRRNHQLCQSDLIRDELGYVDPVSAESALAQTVDWLVRHPPAPMSEADRQIGDPFDYRAEDALIARWRQARQSCGEIKSPLRPRAHVYRHPKMPGEAWSGPGEPSVS